MMLDKIKENRTYRRFSQDRVPSDAELKKIIEGARFSGCSANRQLVRFSYVNDKSMCDKIFGELKFAGYLKQWEGPTEQERPTAYIILFTDREPDVSISIDIGIYAQSMLLVAGEMGYRGCMLRSFNKENIDKLLGKTPYSAQLIIALGVPSETVYLTDASNGDIKYYRDENDFHAVPKLPVEELII